MKTNYWVEGRILLRFDDKESTWEGYAGPRGWILYPASEYEMSRANKPLGPAELQRRIVEVDARDWPPEG